jgi:transposase-like protein
VGDGGEGAKYWHQVLSEINNRGVNDVPFLVCDGLRGLVESVNDIWPLAIVQTCVLHLVRNTFRYASKQYWYEPARDLRTVYTAATEQAARERFDEFAGIGASATQRSSACGKTPGRSSSPSWRTTPRSAKSSTRRTRSRACTRGCAAACVRAVTSRPNRRR